MNETEGKKTTIRRYLMLSVTFFIDARSVVMLNVVMLSVIMLVSLC